MRPDFEPAAWCREGNHVVFGPSVAVDCGQDLRSEYPVLVEGPGAPDGALHPHDRSGMLSTSRTLHFPSSTEPHPELPNCIIVVDRFDTVDPLDLHGDTVRTHPKSFCKCKSVAKAKALHMLVYYPG